MDKLLSIINRIKASKKENFLDSVSDSALLGKDLDFDSFDLAELTVYIEDEFGVDIFEDGIVRTVGEVRARLEDGK